MTSAPVGLGRLRQVRLLAKDYLPPPPPRGSHVLRVFVSRQEEEGPGREEGLTLRSQAWRGTALGVSELGL